MGLGSELEHADRFAAYVNEVTKVIGHADREGPFRDYCAGLLATAGRRSVEPMAVVTDPGHVSKQHQKLLHVVAESPWSDERVLAKVREQVVPSMTQRGPIEVWIIDDTGFPKKGTHSVGVHHQYCGQLGKQANCQVAVTLSIANHHASLPIAYRLYLPREWSDDPIRRKKAHVPGAIRFKTKPQIALEQIRAALKAGIAPGVVLMDAGYGNNSGLRQAITALGLSYVAARSPPRHKHPPVARQEQQLHLPPKPAQRYPSPASISPPVMANASRLRRAGGAYPDIVQAAVERNWKFVGHGLTQTNMQKVTDEAHAVGKTAELIAEATGKRLRGWLGPGLTETWETPEILKAAGYDWVLDDQPVWLKTKSGPILSLPYTQECNDVAMMLIQHHKASEFYDRTIDQFEQIHADAENSARIMAISVHPYIMGAPHRINISAAYSRKFATSRRCCSGQASKSSTGMQRLGPGRREEVSGNWYLRGHPRNGVRSFVIGLVEDH